MMRFPPALLGGILALCVPAIGSERPHEAKAIRPGVTLTMLREQPDLVTPTGVDIDAAGNVWVVASHTHFPPEGYPGPKKDEILVFAEEGMGTRNVFYNETHHTMDLELGPDGWVYLAERDRILRIRDTDGDGKADEEQDIAVLASEAVYPHNGLSGLAWHPDGDLCFALGENFSQAWTLTGTDGSSATGTGEGGIFRCRADGSRLRRIAKGMWNPFGLCVREDGEIFAAENDPGVRPPCRILHIVEGGDYGYQRHYGPGAHHPFVVWNGGLRGSLPMLHPSGEAPCGIAPLAGGLLIPSWGDHRIDYFSLKREGASFTATRTELATGARYFRPTCIVEDEFRSSVGRRVFYLTDWVDGSYNVHGFGRLWKLEIDLNLAPWAAPRKPEPPNDAARLAKKLRNGPARFSRKRLFELAQDEDPFIAHGALSRLAQQARRWKPDAAMGWDVDSRVSAVTALRIAGAEPEAWFPLMLNDESDAVVFETLRWIAEAVHKPALAAVETLLKRHDLSFELFEAGIATWNTLNGKPELGLNNNEVLLARVTDEASPARLRAYALRLLPSVAERASSDGTIATLRFPKGVNAEFLAGLIALGDAELSMETVRMLSGNPTAGQATLAKVAKDSAQPTQIRAEAVAGLAAVADKHLPLLLELAESSPGPIRDEALRALRGQTLSKAQTEQLNILPKSDLTEALLNPGSLAEGRPSPMNTQAWSKRLAALAGDADVDNGRRIFHHASIALCSRCHRHTGRGKFVGPDLSAVGGRSDRAWLLEAILQPNLAMAPEYQPRDIELKDGTIHTGIRLRSYSKEQIRDANGNTLTFGKDQVAAIRDLDRSLMPEGLVYSMTDGELRDLLAYLDGWLGFGAPRIARHGAQSRETCRAMLGAPIVWFPCPSPAPDLAPL